MPNSTQRLVNFLRTLFAVILLLLGGLSGVALAAPTTPTTDFTDNGDGTVTHKTTGLTWKRCAEGQTWTGSTCSGTATKYTWDQAGALTANFAGKDDWRLPRMDELLALIERDNTKPAINGTIFPATQGAFWTSSLDPGTHSSSFVVAFDTGITGKGLSKSFEMFGIATKVDVNYVRLVRGGSPFDPSGNYTPTSDFMDHGDGTVTHKKTGLSWKRCFEGQNWVGVTCSGTPQKYTWAQANALTSNYAGANDWRLPNINEVHTLVEWRLYAPAINQNIFPVSTNNDIYWSSSPDVTNPAFAWHITFFQGEIVSDSKSNFYYVRLVRGRQSVGNLPPLAGLALACPSALNADANRWCSALASYSDASNGSANPVWISSNPTLLAVSSSGYLTAGVPTVDTPVTISASYSQGGVSKTATATVTVKTNSDFIDNNDGTVTQKASGLTWKRCAEGQTWTGATCSGVAIKYTSAQAEALTTTFGGKSDWRLPRIDELTTLVDVDKVNSATLINGRIFPNTPSCDFWAISWEVNFCDGYHYLNYVVSNGYVRLVRGGQSLDISFVDNGNGTVTHKKTGLSWKRCAEGQNWTGATCSGASQTYSWQEASALPANYGGLSDWRLPTANELLSIVEWGKSSPSIDETVFPNTSPNAFWSGSLTSSALSSSDLVRIPVEDQTDAWVVQFDSGFSRSTGKFGRSSVRMVRGGQSVSPSAHGPDCLFNWAEGYTPTIFSPAGSASQTIGAYYYRAYSKSGSYLASSSDGNLYYLDKSSGLLNLGPLTQWYATAGCQP